MVADLAHRLDPAKRIEHLDLYRVELPLSTPLAHSQVATDVLDEVFLALTRPAVREAWRRCEATAPTPPGIRRAW